VWDANLLCIAHIVVMTTYQIIPVADGAGFHIGISGDDGTKRTMLGFTSQEEAEAWIVEDRRLTSGGFLAITNGHDAHMS
jgi:hypothetical protein